ncbi:MAG TPA: DNA polymerase I [Phycisphaerae bacterium]|nr:DNA polymerase I [Phycisphaerae bacterium]
MTQSYYIIDGHAQIYRAYYALPGLTSRSGEPTNATFGFSTALLKLLQERKPTHLALAMDAGSSGREILSADYKAHRKPMPEDMPVQIERICQITATIEIPIFQIPGFEADDVIATLVEKLTRGQQNEDIEIFICSRDKDLDQLISPNVHLYDIQTGEVFDEKALLDKKGYTPAQAADVLALTGDAVDNIPGIPGVGPKTAAKWIAQFGTLDNLIKHADEITGKIGQAFRDNLAVLDQSRQLVALKRDVPLELNLSSLQVNPAALEKLQPIFTELDFHRLQGTLRQVQQTLGAANIPSRPTPDVRLPSSSPPAKTKPTSKPAETGLFSDISSTSSETSLPTPDSQLPSMAASPTLSPLPEVQGDFRLVNTFEDLEKMLRQITADLKESPDRRLAVDTETDSLGAMQSKLCGVSLCVHETLAWYVPVMGPGCQLSLELVRQKLQPLLADPKIKKIGQNLKYDLNVLRNHGFTLDGIFLDTMVASYVVDAARRSHSMDSLARDYLKLEPIPISDLIGTGAKQSSFADVPLDRAARYSAEDADVTMRLARLLLDMVHKQGQDKLLFELEMPIVRILADMEFTGVKVDVALLQQFGRENSKKIADLKQRIMAAAQTDFNPDSPKQLADVLFTKLGLPVIRKNKTGPSTDLEVLETLAEDHEVPALIVEYRQLAKLQSTYLDALVRQVSPKTGRVHASFNQTVAETGRLSSSDPNLQNIPIRTEIGRQIRRAFVAGGPQFCLLVADYSQIELRILAHFCREPALLDAFTQDMDIHQFVATQVYHTSPDKVTPDMRRVAKTVNFGIIYGQTAFGLAKVLKISRQDADAFIAAYKARFPNIDFFARQCVQQAMHEGFVTTISGRRRKIPEILSSNQAVQQFGRRAAINTVIQGSAADLIKQAMVNIDHKIRPSADQIRLILQVHDELVFECRKENVELYSRMIKHEMEHALELSVPLKVDVGWGDNWLEAK